LVPNGVSYIVNLFNKAPYLAGVLKALRAQEGDFLREYILLDGGSADGAGEVARSLTADWPSVRIISHADEGPAAAVNIGAAAATLPWLHIIDGDDLLVPYATMLLLRAAQQGSQDLVISQGAFYRDRAEIRPDRDAALALAPRIPSDAVHEMLRYMPSNMTGSLFRRSAFQAAGGCDERIWIHDFSVSLRVAATGRLAFLDTVTWYGPATDPGRIMIGQKHQLLHDFTAAVLNFVDDHPGLSAAHRALVYRRGAARAFKWARREERQPLLCRFLWLYLRSRLPLLASQASVYRPCLEAFTLSRPVRVPLAARVTA
jgi:glycosyltransferase involved in cell wall biosynthesis